MKFIIGIFSVIYADLAGFNRLVNNIYFGENRPERVPNPNARPWFLPHSKDRRNFLDRKQEFD